MANLYKYASFGVQAFSGNINWTAGNVKVALLTDTYTPSQSTHGFWSDVAASEISGTGYTAGGQAILNPTVSFSTGQNSVILDGDDISWPESTITARYVVLYEDTGVASTSVLCGFADLGENKSSSNGDFNLNWSTSGIFEVFIQSP